MSDKTKNRIYILSGPVHSGKSTRLKQWLEKKQDVFGILTPVEDGRRIFYDVRTKEIFLMELAEDPERDAMPVGKYVFSKKSFDRANAILKNASLQKNAWLLIDEIGPLELRGSGFYDSLIKILDQKREGLNIILVIRDSLVEEVLHFFRISEHEIFDYPA